MTKLGKPLQSFSLIRMLKTNPLGLNLGTSWSTDIDVDLGIVAIEPNTTDQDCVPQLQLRDDLQLTDSLQLLDFLCD